MPSRELMRARWHMGPDWFMENCAGQRIPAPEPGGKSKKKRVLDLYASGINETSVIAERAGCSTRYVREILSPLRN